MKMRQIILATYLLTLAANNISGQIPAQTLPAFTFFKLDQTPFTDKDVAAGKMVFFMFFDADCEHCQRAIQSIGKQYPAFKKAAVYLVSMDDKNKIGHFMDTYGKELKGRKNLLILQDSHKEFITRFKPVKYPSMFLYSFKKKLLDYEDNDESVFKFVKLLSGK